MSGYINDRLGRFAKVGDKFQEGKIDVKVVSVSLYTVEECLITYHPKRKKKASWKRESQETAKCFGSG